MNTFKWVGRVEGASFLFLLLVAMPMKYIFGDPLYVKYAGWLHGVFFMAYFAAAIYVFFEYKWSVKKLALAAVASLLPLGPWIFEKRLISEH